MTRRSFALFVTVIVSGSLLAAVPPSVPADLSTQVEIIRTANGVPHIRAENLRAGGFGLAWVMSEDYGSRTGLRLLVARGEWSRLEGRARLDADFENLQARARAIETYHLLDPETRDIYDGFAAGINRYVTLHAGKFPPGMPADFSGYDVATIHIGDPPPPASVRRFLAALNGTPSAPDAAVPAARDDDVGSNAWALAPSRTKSNRAILLRNPHLQWNAGYYEAHLTVPGVVDFYGDFRIGGPLIVIGGFNRNLGWATTNSNSGDLTEFYAIDRDPKDTGRYVLDGVSLPLRRESLTVSFKDGDAMRPETREFLSTPFGRVVHADKDTLYVARTAGDGEYRAGEQFLRMMRASSLKEWKDAMRIRGLVTSNYTYADRAGNILNLWNAALPWLPHAEGGDRATPIQSMAEMWTRYIPFEGLPQFLNPRGGYVHNENDSPHFANVRGRLNLVNAYPNIEPPVLRLRSQHAIQLIGGNDRLSLEDVVRRKHSYRMLLADRVKPDLLAALRRAKVRGEIAAAARLLRNWNNTAAPSSRGAMLFEIWYQRYSQGRPVAEIFKQPWTQEDPLRTPRGLADPERAIEALDWAVGETARRHGSWDVAWGDVHRVRRGTVDVPVGGCAGALGCFRVLTFARDADGKLSANGGDGWVLAVEFGPTTPRAYSVLAYGESQDPSSPWHADQAEMFAAGRLKKVAFTARDVDATAVSRYRPGQREAR